MNSAICIVCDRNGDWAAAWRSIAETAAIIETRGIDDCRRALAEHPSAWVVIEVWGENAPSVLDLVAEIDERFLRAAAIAIVEPRWRDALEGPLRECGARYVMSSHFELPALAAAARRHWAVAAQTSNKLPRSLRQRMFDRLPWNPSGHDNEELPTTIRGENV